MSLSNETPIRTYCGNGTTVQWSLPFTVKKEAHVGVYLTSPAGKETRLTENFSVDLTEQTVTYPTLQSELAPLAQGWKITLRRHTPLTQQVDLTQQGELDVEALEGGLDKTVMQIQELAEELSRAVTFRPAQDGAQTDAQAYLEELHASQTQAVSQVTQITQEAVASAQTAIASAAAAIEAAQAANQEVAQSVQTAQTAVQQAQQASQQAVSAQTALNTYVTQAEAAKEATRQAQTAAAQSASASESASALAKKWAVQTSAEVAAGEGYGSKKYAQDAAASAQQAQTAQTECAANASAALASKNAAAVSSANADEKAAQAGNYASAAQTSAQSAADTLTSVNNAGSTQTAAINAAGEAQVAAVNTAGAEQIQQAKDWASKTSGPVADGEYSSKKYAQDAAVSAANSRGLAVGTVYYSQSSLNTDNPGALPLFTGETIASANTVYPDFWAWVSAHEELCVTAEAYASALETYGECPYYVLDAAAGSMRLPKLAHYVKMANATDGIAQQKAGLPDHTHPIIQTMYAESGDTDNHIADGGNSAGASLSIQTETASDANAVYGASDTVTPAHTTLYPWVMAFTHAVEASVAQASAFQQGLSQKMDRMSLWSSDTFTCLRRKMTDLDWANLQTAGTGTSYTSHTFTVPFDGVLFGISPYSQKITLNGQVLPCYTGGDYGASLYAPLPVNRGDVVKGYMYPAYCFVVPYKLQGGENILSTGLNYYGKYASLEALNAASATVLSNGYGQGLWALVGGEATGYTRYYTKPVNDTFTSYEWAEGGTDMYVGPDADYVVERYRDENGNWYRKYKSGWLEQGGWAASNGINEITVTLLKPFANTKYWAFSTLEQAGTANVCGQCYSGSKKTATAFQTYLQQSSGWWYAGGQGAEE